MTSAKPKETTVRTVIYARFSSQLQNSRSIDDQVAVCRDRADREGWPIVEVFTDYAISGAAGIGVAQRPGLAALLAAVEGGGIDQVLTESTDRIARHEGDSFAIRERLTYAGARLFTLSDGEVTQLTGTIKGLMDAQFRKELGAKIKRGQRGTVSAGRSPAGLAYGYRTANRIDANGRPIRGLREIDDEHAAIVRRIFREFAEGKSARTIAGRLAAEGVPGPRGSHWRASTIQGDAKRGNGILLNRLYVGEIVHNRTSKIVEPMTRKVRIRTNPLGDWQVEQVPHLRILDDATWDAAQERRASYQGIRPTKCVRPRRMLSGLGVCGVCGSSWIVISGEKWGCARYTNDGSCSNNRKVMTTTFEARVIAGMSEQMLDPDVVAVYVKEYHEHYARRASDNRRERAKLEKRLVDATSRIDRLVAAIASGAGEFAEIKDAMQKARSEREAAAEHLQDLDTDPVIALHPTIAADYRRNVDDLNAKLADPYTRDEAVPTLRKMIDRIVLTPAETGRGVNIAVEGRLAAMLALSGAMPPARERTVVMERVKGIEPSS